MKKMSITGMMAIGLLAISYAAVTAAETPAPAPTPGQVSNLNATISNYKGTVEYAAPGSSDFKPISQETPIPLGSKIRTGGTGQVTIVPFPGAAMTLSPNSLVDMSTMNITTENKRIAKKTALLDLKQGMATIAIDHNAAKQIPVDFKLKTPTSVASAVGTQYVVVVVGGLTYVKVLDGTVNFGKFGATPTPVNSVSGVAVLNPDGTVSFLSGDQVPAGVTTALNNAPIQETEGDATIGAVPGGTNPRFPGQTSNGPNSIQKLVSPEA